MSRSKVRILHDVLETVADNGGCTKTKIIRLANLDWNMANDYIDTLLEEGYLETYEDESERGGSNYGLTEDGEEFLEFSKEGNDKSSIF